MIALLATLALAETPELRSETLVELRANPPGGPFGGGLEALGGTAAIGDARVEGYGDFGWSRGIDAPFGGELYVLAADGDVGAVRWTVGRQPLILPTWSRRLDGGALSWQADRSLAVSAAIGLGSQSGLPGALDGTPIARLAAAWTRSAFHATAGVWGEAGAVPAGHGDLEATWGSATTAHHGEVGGIGAVGVSGGEAVLERGRLQAGYLPVSGVRTLAWLEHRQALENGSAIAPNILATFAPSGSDAAGVAVGLTTPDRARLWASGAVQRWSPTLAGPATDRVTALLGELRWQPKCAVERWCLAPSWQGAVGSDGVYHRTGAVLSLPLPAVVKLDLNAAWVPYRKPRLDWQAAWVAGARADVAASDRVTLEAGTDVLVDGVRPTTRGWLAVQVRAGGAP